MSKRLTFSIVLGVAALVWLWNYPYEELGAGDWYVIGGIILGAVLLAVIVTPRAPASRGRGEPCDPGRERAEHE